MFVADSDHYFMLPYGHIQKVSTFRVHLVIQVREAFYEGLGTGDVDIIYAGLHAQLIIYLPSSVRNLVLLLQILGIASDGHDNGGVGNLPSI